MLQEHVQGFWGISASEATQKVFWKEKKKDVLYAKKKKNKIKK